MERNLKKDVQEQFRSIVRVRQNGPVNLNMDSIPGGEHVVNGKAENAYLNVKYLFAKNLFKVFFDKINKINKERNDA